MGRADGISCRCHRCHFRLGRPRLAHRHSQCLCAQVATGGGARFRRAPALPRIPSALADVRVPSPTPHLCIAARVPKLYFPLALNPMLLSRLRSLVFQDGASADPRGRTRARATPTSVPGGRAVHAAAGRDGDGACMARAARRVAAANIGPARKGSSWAQHMLLVAVYISCNFQLTSRTTARGAVPAEGAQRMLGTYGIVDDLEPVYISVAPDVGRD